MHIDARSWYSFHDGVSSPEALCAQAAELGFDALGIADVDGAYGLIGFYKAARKYGLHPVLGVSFTDPRGDGGGNHNTSGSGGVSAAVQRAHVGGTEAAASGGLPPTASAAGTPPLPGSKAARATGTSALPSDGRNGQPRYASAPDLPGTKTGKLEPRPLRKISEAGLDWTPVATVLARDRDGYSELCELASRRHLDPGFDLARALERGTDHCYVISDRPALIDRLARRLGPGRMFVRTSPDYGDAYRAHQLRQLKLAAYYRLHPVACTDVRFLRPQDQPLHHVLRAIGQNATLYTAQGVVPRAHYLSAPVELGGYYYGCPEAVTNSRRLAEGCLVEFELGRWLFPEYPLKDGSDPRQMLRDLCQRGLVWRYRQRAGGAGGYDQRHLARLDYELSVIDKLGFTSYFLAVYDIVRAAGKRGIPCLGRGSAANSIVSYLLGLTPVDPIALNMYFERFLNPERKSPPDIDIDFSSKRRDEILDYVYERWGTDRAAMISTHVTFRARGAFREVSKVFGLSDKEITQIARHMPHTSAQGLTTIARNFPEMRGIDLRAEPYRHIIPLASRLDGCPRHLGIHCGGVVIAPTRLTEFTALARAAKGLNVTQYEMFSIEDVGLIKIDLLGNCGLDAFEETLKTLARRGVKPPVHELDAVIADQDTVDTVREGRTMGCFYIESPGMRQLLKRLNTQTFLELTAASSVIRPGVAESGMMQEYIRRVRGEEPRQPSHPLMLKLLPETRGVMIYQEDVIKVAHKLAGLSLAEADLLRRAMSGKMRGMGRMNEVRERFLDGCDGNGVDTSSALAIWRQIASFSGYSFCKAHSAAFASLSWKVAYLKTHYPAEYMSAVLSHHGGFYGSRAYLSECQRMGLSVLAPDVNYSGMEYKAEEWDGGKGRGKGEEGRDLVARAAVPADVRKQPEAAASVPPVWNAGRAARATGTPPLPNNEKGSGKREGGREPHYNAVRVSLSEIKGVRSATMERIVADRQSRGRFSALPEFIRRVQPQRADLEVLIQCGALDSLGLPRPELMWLADGEHRAGVRGGELPLDESGRSRDFRERVGTKLIDHDELTRCDLELQHLGMLASRHPLELVTAKLPPGVVNAIDLAHYAGKHVRLLGWCIAVKRVDLRRRKEVRDTLELQGGDPGGPNPYASAGPGEDDERDNPAADLGIIRKSDGGPRPGQYEPRGGRAMKFLSMEDLTATFEVVLFPQAYEQFAPVTNYAGPFLVAGRVEEQFDTYTVNATGLRLLSLDGEGRP